MEQIRRIGPTSAGWRAGMGLALVSRTALGVLTAWALAMVLPSFYQLARPLASFGLSVDNDGIITDVVRPFDIVTDSPAAAAGLATGERLNLRRMTCLHPASRTCADLVMVLGGAGGLQYVLPGQEMLLSVLSHRDGPPREVHLRARLAGLHADAWRVLLANTVIGVLFALAAFWLVWSRPSAMTWGFFLYAVWFNPGQTYAYYAVLQSWPAALLAEQGAEGFAVGSAYAGLLVFALRVPAGAADPRWRHWERAGVVTGAALGLLTLLGGANLFGWPTEAASVAAYCGGYVVNAVVFALLVVRRRGLHPRDAQRMRWVIAGCAIGLPSFMFASLCQSTGWLQNVWGDAPSQTVIGLLFLVQGVLAFFVCTAVQRQRVISVAIPLRHGTVTAALTLALAVPVVFLHEQLAKYHEELHLPVWVWPLVGTPIMLIALQRLHEIAVDLVDHACNRSYHQARRRFAEAGREMLAADGFAAIDRRLVEEPVRSLRLTSSAVFREQDGTLRRTE